MSTEEVHVKVSKVLTEEEMNIKVAEQSVKDETLFVYKIPDKYKDKSGVLVGAQMDALIYAFMCYTLKVAERRNQHSHVINTILLKKRDAKESPYVVRDQIKNMQIVSKLTEIEIDGTNVFKVMMSPTPSLKSQLKQDPEESINVYILRKHISDICGAWYNTSERLANLCVTGTDPDAIKEAYQKMIKPIDKTVMGIEHCQSLKVAILWRIKQLDPKHNRYKIKWDVDTLKAIPYDKTKTSGWIGMKTHKENFNGHEIVYHGTGSKDLRRDIAAGQVLRMVKQIRASYHTKGQKIDVDVLYDLLPNLQDIQLKEEINKKGKVRTFFPSTFMAFIIASNMIDPIAKYMSRREDNWMGHNWSSRQWEEIYKYFGMLKNELKDSWYDPNPGSYVIIEGDFSRKDNSCPVMMIVEFLSMVMQFIDYENDEDRYITEMFFAWFCMYDTTHLVRWWASVWVIILSNLYSGSKITSIFNTESSNWMLLRWALKMFGFKNATNRDLIRWSTSGDNFLIKISKELLDSVSMKVEDITPSIKKSFNELHHDLKAEETNVWQSFFSTVKNNGEVIGPVFCKMHFTPVGIARDIKEILDKLIMEKKKLTSVQTCGKLVSFCYLVGYGNPHGYNIMRQICERYEEELAKKNEIWTVDLNDFMNSNKKRFTYSIGYDPKSKDEEELTSFFGDIPTFDKVRVLYNDFNVSDSMKNHAHHGPRPLGVW